MSNQNIPFLDLITPHKELEEELVAAFRATLHTAGFIGGPAVTNFETDFAKFCESKHSVAVNSGTDALRFALIAAGVKTGDVVVTVPNTFIATTEAISQAGATPEFVDIDERTYTLCPKMLRAYFEQGCTKDASGRMISKRSGKPVAGVVPVHLYGQMADMDPIIEIAAKYNLVVIEDACQAHGAQYFSKKENRWRTAGSMGKASAFSFYPGKNLGACGEAGAITTDDEGVAKICRMLRDHGQAQKYYHDIEGYNGRLDSIQCSFLHIKLKHLAKWNEQRRAAAKRYDELFAGNDAVILPVEPAYSKSVYHLYVVRVQGREELQKQLSAVGIGTGIHYPVPLHQQKAYAHLGYKTGDFPVTERVTPEIVSLPMFPNLAAEQQKAVVKAVVSYVGEKAGVAVGR
jgi:dTDP-4-amino-4,6-dideoxygalactose transaminase